MASVTLVFPLMAATLFKIGPFFKKKESLQPKYVALWYRGPNICKTLGVFIIMVRSFSLYTRVFGVWDMRSNPDELGIKFNHFYPSTVISTSFSFYISEVRRCLSMMELRSMQSVCFSMHLAHPSRLISRKRPFCNSRVPPRSTWTKEETLRQRALPQICHPSQIP